MKKVTRKFLIPIIIICSFIAGFFVAAILSATASISLLGLRQKADGTLETAIFRCRPYSGTWCNDQLEANYQLMNNVCTNLVVQKLNEQSQNTRSQNFTPMVPITQTPSLQQIMDQGEQRQLNQEMLKFFQNVNRP